MNKKIKYKKVKYLEDKSDAFYRRLLVLDMNQMIPRDEKDIRLKEKIKAEADYAIHMAVTALKDVYERGELRKP